MTTSDEHKGLSKKWSAAAEIAEASLREDMHELIERSSLGSPSAKRLRESVPVEVGEEIVCRAIAQRERDQLVDLLLTYEWRTEPADLAAGTAHAEHIYHYECAICRHDLASHDDAVASGGVLEASP